VFVAATTQCYPDLPLDEAIEKLAHLEFSHIDIHVSEDSNHLKSSEIVGEFQKLNRIWKRSPNAVNWPRRPKS